MPSSRSIKAQRIRMVSSHEATTPLSTTIISIEPGLTAILETSLVVVESIRSLSDLLLWIRVCTIWLLLRSRVGLRLSCLAWYSKYGGSPDGNRKGRVHVCCCHFSLSVLCRIVFATFLAIVTAMVCRSRSRILMRGSQLRKGLAIL